MPLSRLIHSPGSVGNMNDDLLKRSLQSIGKECFVTYFPLFSSESLSNADIAGIIYEERAYKYNSCRSRTSTARRIIRAGRAMDALQLVSRSEGVPFTIREEAGRIATQL